MFWKLFGTLTISSHARYPEVLSAQIEKYYSLCEHPTVKAEMDKTIEKIAAGHLPHGAIVLKNIINKMIEVKVESKKK